jgi:hypothetical protein
LEFALLGLAALTIVVMVLVAVVPRWLRRREDERQKHRDALRPQIADKGLTDQALLGIYPDELLGDFQKYSVVIDGKRITMPLVTRADWLGFRAKFDTERCRVAQEPWWPAEKYMAHVNRAHVERLRGALDRSKALTWSDPIYRLMDIEIKDDRISAQFAVDDFFNNIRNSGLMAIELEEALLDAKLDPRIVAKIRSKALPLRNALLANGDQIGDVSERMTPIGITVVFAKARPAPDNDYAVPIVRRTGAVALGRNMLAMVPQGIHQPLDDHVADCGLTDTVYRELYEEVLGGEDEVRQGGNRFQRRWYMDSSPALQWISQHPEHCTQEFVCCGYNLITGNFELGALLAVHDPEFWNEYKSTFEYSSEIKGVTLLSTTNASHLSEMIRRPDWTPESRPALVEGLRRLQELDSTRVSLPHLDRFPV